MTDFKPGMTIYPITTAEPSAWCDYAHEQHATRQYYSALDLSDKRLQIVLESLSFEEVDAQLVAEGSLPWRTELAGAKLDVVEEEDSFRYRVMYTTAFAKFLHDYGRLPNHDEFWQTWAMLNVREMEVNMNPDFRDTEGQPSRSAALHWSQNPNLNRAEVVLSICNAARYRCGKALSALHREFWSILYLTKDIVVNGRTLKACHIQWHPLLDGVGKIDAVVNVPDSEMGDIGLAVFLASRHSYAQAERKFRDVPSVITQRLDWLFSLPVNLEPSATNRNTVALPDEATMRTIRRALGGNDAAMSRINGGINWKNPYPPTRLPTRGTLI